MALDSGLSAFWQLTEADNTLTWPELIGGNHLTNINGVDYGALFDGTNYLVCNDAPGVSCGDTTFTIGTWLQPQSFATSICLASKGWVTNSDPGREFIIHVDSATKCLWFTVWDGTVNQGQVRSSVVLTVSTWYYLFAWHDSVANKLGIQVFGGTPNGVPEEVTHSSGVLDGTGTFRIGSSESGGFWNGTIWQYNFWRRLLSAAEKKTMFSDGWGFSWPYPRGIEVDLRAYWKLEEASGTRIEARANFLDLYPTGAAIANAVGKQGNAIQFVAADTSALYCNDQSPLRTGDHDWTYACWFYYQPGPGYHFVLGCKGWDVGTPAQNEWIIYVDGGSSRVNIIGQLLGTENGPGPEATVIAASTWHLAIGWYDAAADSLGIQIDNGTPHVASGAPFAGGTGGATGAEGNFMIGRTYDGTWCTGKIDEAGFWKRVLSASERSQLWNGGAGITYPFSLTAGMVGYWKLDEASGGRVDSSGLGGNMLTPSGTTINSRAGKISNGADFVAANNSWLRCATNGNVQMGDIDFTIALWVYVDSMVANQTMLCKNDGVGGGVTDYQIFFHSAKLGFYTSRGGSNWGYVESPSSGTAATWYFVVCIHDSVNDLVKVSINGGSFTTAAFSGGSGASFDYFNIGAAHGGSEHFDGIIDEVGIWKRVLKDSEVLDLWNGGAGRTFPFNRGQPARKRFGAVPHMRLTSHSSVW